MENLHLPHQHGNNNLEDIAKQLDRTYDFQILSDLFKQLGDSSRIRIFWLLCHCEECVTNISTLVGMSSPAVSHHLRQLKASGLITSRREGKEVYYRASKSCQSKVLHITIEKIMEISCPQ